MFKKVDYVNFGKNTDPELMERLNAVAPGLHQPVNRLVRIALREWLDQHFGNSDDVSARPLVG